MQKDETGKVEELLKDLGKRIDLLIEEGKKAKDEIRDDLETKITDLKRKKESLEEEFKTGKTGEKWKEAKVHLAAAGDELKKAMDSLFSKK